MTKSAATLKLIDDLRARGAKMVKVGKDGTVEVIFDGPARAPGEETDPQAEHEAQKRRAAGKVRSLDDKLLRPLGIKKGEEDAA